MSYIHKNDYSSQVRDEIRSIISNNDALLADAQDKAVSQVQSYLNERYEVASIFIDTSDYDNTATYSVGDQVYYTPSGGVPTVYTATVAGSGNLPTDTNYWQVGDARHKHLLRITIDIVLYILYYANSPRSVPAHVEKNYDEAITWLEKISAAKLNPGLPLITDDPANPVRIISEIEKDDPYW